MTEKVFVPPIKIQGIKTKLVPVIKENISMEMCIRDRYGASLCNIRGQLY